MKAFTKKYKHITGKPSLQLYLLNKVFKVINLSNLWGFFCLWYRFYMGF